MINTKVAFVFILKIPSIDQHKVVVFISRTVFWRSLPLINTKLWFSFCWRSLPLINTKSLFSFFLRSLPLINTKLLFSFPGLCFEDPFHWSTLSYCFHFQDCVLKIPPSCLASPASPAHQGPRASSTAASSTSWGTNPAST